MKIREEKSQLPGLGLLIALTALGAGSILAWYVWSLGLTAVLSDQNAHLNIARQTIDSLTPGVSQLGFWPPLLHLLMIPAVSNALLYSTGLAGAVTLTPFLAIGAVFLYKLIVLLSGSRFAAFFGALVFVVNPYVLYYSVTPMMEVLFLAALFGSAYFLSAWTIKGRFRDLLGSALFITFTVLTRFEGLILIPLAIMIILAKLVWERKRYAEVEAVVILFSLVACLGVFAIITYSWMFGGDPLAFMLSEWSASSQQQDYLRPTEGSFAKSLEYLLHSSFYMHGGIQVILGILAFIFLILLFPRFPIFSALLMLGSPLIFDLLALWNGNIILYVWELPPFNWFYNERYGIYWIGFTLAAPAVLFGLFLENVKSSQFLKGAVASLALAFLGIGAAYFYDVAIAEEYRVIRLAAEKIPSRTQITLAREFSRRYDYGKILMTRAAHDFVPVAAGIPLKNYIHESNYRFYDQAFERPWLFARWVIMFNNSLTHENEFIPNWSRKNEKISLRWGESRIFNRYYDLVVETKFSRLYRLKEEEVRRYAAREGLTTGVIPSLNPAVSDWNPEHIYAEMRGERLASRPDPEPHGIIAPEKVFAEEAGQEEPHPLQDLLHEVKRGDNLWRIAEKYFGSGSRWRTIAEENKITRPNLIYPGELLMVSEAEIAR